ncbi:tRNA lysidine(34) synthetase TilS [Oceanobacillus limi]|nr:tRNA lysidine(34) synthetase TilS [Oceanobacillus limi]
MLDQVTAFINKHELLTKKATVLVGVSGGPDSMALLHYLKSIRAEWELTIIALTVDHQLRGDESKADAQYVLEMCQQWGIRLISTSVDVEEYKREKSVGTQVAARELRYAFFREQMEELKGDYLALGHHGDDQVETMVMRFVRTANSSSFSGMPFKRKLASGMLIRPLLCVTKEEIQNYCSEHQITPRLDPSNETTEYTRNYFRKFVLPILKEKNNNIHTTVQHLSESLQEDENYLRNQAKHMFENVVHLLKENKGISVDIEVFQSYATALQRRTYHLILNYLYDELPDNLSYVHEEQFFALLHRDKSNVKLDFPQQLKVDKSYKTITFSFHKPGNDEKPTYHYLLDVPGEVILPNGTRISAKHIKGNESFEESSHTFVCSLASSSFPLHIRTRAPGDRMSWKGLNGSKKVKDIFIDAKIPLTDRDSWPIVTDNNGEILWLVGLKKGQSGSCKENTSLIQLYYEKGKY